MEGRLVVDAGWTCPKKSLRLFLESHPGQTLVETISGGQVLAKENILITCPIARGSSLQPPVTPSLVLHWPDPAGKHTALQQLSDQSRIKNKDFRFEMNPRELCLWAGGRANIRQQQRVSAAGLSQKPTAFDLKKSLSRAAFLWETHTSPSPKVISISQMRRSGRKLTGSMAREANTKRWSFPKLFSIIHHCCCNKLYQALKTKQLKNDLIKYEATAQNFLVLNKHRRYCWAYTNKKESR